MECAKIEQLPLTFDTRLICPPDQSHIHAREHHQLAISLTGHVEFEVNGCDGEVCRMRARLVPGEAGHMFAGADDNCMLIIDLGESNPTPKGPGLSVHLFEAPRYPTLGTDFQNLLSYAGVELVHYGSDPLLTRAFDGVLIHALHLHLFGEQQPLVASGPLDPEHLDAHIVRNPARRITVARLAQVVCLNLSHFHVQFKDSVGLTPYQYLLRVRLGYAARLLWESRLPLAWIAEECGFPSQSVPTTVMHCYLGLTPKPLRKGRASSAIFGG